MTNPIDITGDSWTDNRFGGKTWEGERFVCLTRGYSGGTGLLGLEVLDKTTGDVYTFTGGNGQPVLDHGTSQDGYQSLYGAAFRAVMGRQAVGEPRYLGGSYLRKNDFPSILRGMYFAGRAA